MEYTHLPARGLLEISGPEAISFLQGLITQDARLLEKGEPIYACLLTPQGKYQHDFFIYPEGGSLLLDGEKNRLPDLLARLKLYKLRSNVTIAALPDTQSVVALWGDTKMRSRDRTSPVCISDPRLSELGYRMAGDIKEILAWCASQGWSQVDEKAYDQKRLALGVPDGSRDMIPEKSLMLECGMDKLGAISFDKGCYVGQEVTARSRFRGQVRKMFYCVKAVEGTLPATGTAVTLGGKDAGEMRSHHGDIGLAMLRTEVVEGAAGAFFEAEGCRLLAHVPFWNSDEKNAEKSTR